MARFLCDFYVYKASQLVAKYVNAILTEGEAQASANGFLKQYGATRVCATNKGATSGPPRAPIKTASTALPANTHCWVQAPQTMGQTVTCPPGYVFQNGKCAIKSPVPSQCPPGTQPVNGICVPIPKTGPGGRVLRKPGIVAGPFDGIGGGDGMLGASVVITYILVAYKGTKILKQWGRAVTMSGSWSIPGAGGGSSGPVPPSAAEMAKKHWSEAKQMGADRLCVHTDYYGGPWLCYNGYGFSEGLTLPKAPQTITCPSGQVWDNVAKKCVNAQGVSAYGKGVAFPMPKPNVPTSRGPAPQLSPLTQPALNTSFLRPQLSGLPFSLGNVGDPPNLTGKYKGILLLWSKSPGVSSPVPNFGSVPSDLTAGWNCLREGRMLSAFSKWWNSKGNKLSEGTFAMSGTCKGILTAELDAPHMAALDAFAAGATKVVDPNAAGQWPSDPTPTLACADQCQQKYGPSSPGGPNAVALIACLAECTKANMPPIQPIPGGIPSVPGGDLPPPPAPKPPQGGGTPPPSGVQDCDGKNPCPAGQICVGGKCQPALPAPPKSPDTSSTKGSNTGLWIAGGVAALGALALIFGGGKRSLLLLNPRRPLINQPFHLDDIVIIDKRKSDGSLDFSAPQPPKISAKFSEVYNWMFRDDPNAVGSWEHLSEWLKRRGWVLRKKTW